MNWNVTVGAEVEVGLSPSASVSTEVSVGGEVSVGFETETSHSVESSHSDFLTDSRTRTETSASGSMSGGIRLVNTSPVSYTITDLGMTVRYLQAASAADARPSFQTLATLSPALGANGITLAPGDSTPVFQVSATGLNASRVKQFMARPNSLYLEPAFYELENANGLSFAYLEEVTRWRTARVQVDYGNGTNEEYRVATNVERNEGGSYAGVTLGNVLSDILHIPFQTVPRRNLQTNSPTNERVLSSVRSVATISPTNGFWAVVWSGDGTPQTNADFENIALQAGEQVLLVFVRDEDGDGLFGAEEQHYGTDGSATADSDRDGLFDNVEVREGWNVSVANRPSYHVYSDPAQADQDGDGLNDYEESRQYGKGTDPAKADTDDDGISDRSDLFPLVPAKVLRVKWNAAQGGNSATDGATWNTALTNLQDALTLARNGLASIDNSADDIAEIWVAAGTYQPTSSTSDRSARFSLVNNTALYGGFTGGETKLSQRDPDPLSNETILSGDLLGNDTSTPWDDPTTFNDNSHAVCEATSGVRAGTVLDGFTITGGNSPGLGGGLFSLGRPTLRNLLFRANYGWSGPGLHIELPNAEAEPYVISDCVFLQNSAHDAGAMIYFGHTNQVLIVTNCQFYENESTPAGGGALVLKGGEFNIVNCSFSFNRSAERGGAIAVLRPATVRISRCEFLENTAVDGGGAVLIDDFAPTGGNLKVEVLQSVFWGNATASINGSAIYVKGGTRTGKRLYVLNSSIVNNVSKGGDYGGAIVLENDLGWIENSIVWGNSPKGISSTTVARLSTRSTCLEQASSYSGNRNINADPKLVDSFGGNLRLQSDSPCINRGNNYMDYDALTPGFQPLPATDMDGNPRIVDGKGDGTKTVDMGAYELPGP